MIGGNMKLTIPYTYEEMTIPYRCRKPRPVRFDAEITLTVKEPSKEDFPVVAILHTHFWSKDEDGRRKVELRKLGNHFYSKDRWPYMHNKAEGIEVSDLARQIGFSSCYSYYDTDFHCGKQDARKRLMAASREFAVFGGEVWIRCGEPMYLVQTFRLGHNHSGTALFVEGSYNPNISKRAYVPATDLNGAIELFFKTAYGRGDTENAGWMKDDIENGEFFDKHDYVEVIDPYAFTANPERDGYDGDPFLNGVEAMVRGTDSPLEAGLPMMAMALKD